MKLLACLLAMTLAAGCAVAGARDDDAGFRDLGDQLAARTDRRVIAWGEAPLAGDRRPRRFAVLEPADLQHGRGAYLIEDKPRALWLVTFPVDGRTMIWGLAPDAPLDGDARWQLRADRALEHAQPHPHGGESIEFALRRGQLVVLSHDYLGEEATEVVERQRFAVDGVCADPCPPLRGFPTEDLELEVVGPVRDVDALYPL